MLASIPAQGMFRQFSQQMRNTLSSKIVRLASLSNRSYAAMKSYAQKAFTQTQISCARNKTTIYSALFNAGILSSLAAWLNSINQAHIEKLGSQPVPKDIEQECMPSKKADHESDYKSKWHDACNETYQALASKPWGEVSAERLKELQKLQQQLDNELYALLDITHQEWQQFKKDHHQEYIDSVHQQIKKIEEQNNMQAIDPRIVSAVKNACLQVGFDYNNITLVVATDSIASVMSIKHNYLMIHEKLCLLPMVTNDQVREVSVAREIYHLLHDDEFDKYCINKMLAQGSNKTSQERLRAFIQQVSHFKEERADALTTLTDFHYGLTGQKTFKLFSNPPWAIDRIVRALGKDLKDPSPATHPSSLCRYNYVSALCHKMIETIEGKNKVK